MTRRADLVCLSHLRWGFVFQRPNHLMSRFARERRVFFVEEPVYGEGPATMETREVAPQLLVCTPRLPDGLDPARAEAEQKRLMRSLMRAFDIERPVLWFYTPMALPLVDDVDASQVIYDCMDELSLFHGAPPELLPRERALMDRADVVFTGGHSLYEAKRAQHPDAHPFPSSVDAAHFAKARGRYEEPADQRSIAHPRVGFYGVIDERMDLALLARLADERPEYHFVIIGPVVKIDPEGLPRRHNIHWLGPKTYAELPRYLAGWDVAFMPFALNDATRFISPTKTLEYLAAAKPVVSTAIRDVVHPYGELGIVRVAAPDGFAQAIDDALDDDPATHAARCAAVVARTSWDETWRQMVRRMDAAARPEHRAERAEESAECSTM